MAMRVLVYGFDDFSGYPPFAKKKTIKRLLCYRTLHFRQYIVCIPISTQLALDNALKIVKNIDLKVDKNGK